MMFLAFSAQFFLAALPKFLGGQNHMFAPPPQLRGWGGGAAATPPAPPLPPPMTEIVAKKAGIPTTTSVGKNQRNIS